MSLFSQELIWWITVVDLPVLGSLFWLIWRNRRETDKSIRHSRDVIETRNSQMREALSAFKLEVAKNYVSVVTLKDLETRIIDHLLRIETKLDATSMKAEALRAKNNLNE